MVALSYLRLQPPQWEQVRTRSPIVGINYLVKLENIAPDLRHTETLFSGRTCQGLRTQFTGVGEVLKEQSFLGICRVWATQMCCVSVLVPRCIINYVAYYIIC